MDYKTKLNKIIDDTFKVKNTEDCATKNQPVIKNSKKRILFIDDNQTLCDMYAMKFELNGYEVKKAYDGKVAIELIKKGYAPDILITDLMIPVLDGFSIFEIIKKENLIPNVIAIMLTNKGLPEEINRAKELGFHGFIVKAMTIPAEVVETVDKICKDNCR